MTTTGNPILNAARRMPVPYTPIWFMRQAGRVLPEYRRVREKYDLLSICRHPELCAEVTLQPVKRLDVDAAIIFSDIVLPLLGAGVGLHVADKVGPIIHSPVRTLEDVAALGNLEPEEDLDYLLEGIRIVRKELPEDKALIGFSGAPFTLATYLIEGKPSRDYSLTKTMMYREPDTWRALMEWLTRLTINYLKAQVQAGVQLVQLFDSWVGWLSPRDYEEYVLPYSKRIFDALRDSGALLVHFGTGTAGMLELMGETGADIVGVDWRIPLDVAWSRLGAETAIQGNLDPATLLGPFSLVQAHAEDILTRANGRPGHVFSLGHGLLPQTPLDNIIRLVEFVHQRTVRSIGATEVLAPGREALEDA